MNGQQAYEKVREYFTREGAELSKMSGRLLPKDGSMPGCFYRHPSDGRACAVGVLLTDEEYNAMLAEQTELRKEEGLPAPGSLMLGVSDLAELKSYPDHLEDLDITFLSRMQACHDSAENVEEFIRNLDELAEERGLTVVT